MPKLLESSVQLGLVAMVRFPNSTFLICSIAFLLSPFQLLCYILGDHESDYNNLLLQEGLGQTVLRPVTVTIHATMEQLALSLNRLQANTSANVICIMTASTVSSKSMRHVRALGGAPQSVAHVPAQKKGALIQDAIRQLENVIAR